LAHLTIPLYLMIPLRGGRLSRRNGFVYSGLMNSLQSLRQRFAYEAWTEERILGALDQEAESRSDALSLFAHILCSGRVWHRRLQGEDGVGESLWPRWTLEECAREAKSLKAAWETYFSGLGEDDLDSLSAYRESKGVPVEIRVDQILEHVLFHAAYHRGQISTALRRNGAHPVNTDFINFLREHNTAGI
jgi:uncharacterized damage-inducible protein DinB